MKKIVFSTLISFVSFIHINAQIKIVTDANVGLNNSFGKDVLQTHYTGYPYFSRKKYQHPFLNITGNISYSITNNFSVGFLSGIYRNLLEEYTSWVQRTTVSIPLQLTSRFNLLNSKRNPFGIYAAYGFNFFKIDDRLERYGNGKILNATLFYLINHKHLLKIGVENQTDNVKFYVYKFEIYKPPNEISNYKINRLSLALSYGIEF